MLKNKIRVMIIDDSTFFREALAVNLLKDPDIEIAGSAPDSIRAAELIDKIMPDVITLDVEMPGMNGIDFLRKIMPRYAIPVVVVSSVSKSVFDALSAGAVDFVTKPDNRAGIGYDTFINDLKVKIKIASTANRSILKKNKEYEELGKSKSNINVIAIGASTGGTEALYDIIKLLPRNMPGMVIVQHMPPVFTRMYSERLNNSCALEVKEAENGDKVLRGRVLIAPGDFQMRLKKANDTYMVECAKGERVSGHCPSVDVLFQSVAEKAGSEAAGVILTGMGGDGAQGLLSMRNKGAKTIGQDESTCVVYGMPKVAYDIGAVEKQMPIGKIADALIKLSGI